MRYLGIDYGKKRVGVALTDSGETMAFPLKTLAYSSDERLIGDIAALMQEEEARGVILGLPLGLDGQETEQSKTVRKFAALLNKNVSGPVHLVNEALSSYEAETSLIRQNIPLNKRKEVLDQMAAVTILEIFLNDKQSVIHGTL